MSFITGAVEDDDDVAMRELQQEVAAAIVATQRARAQRVSSSGNDGLARMAAEAQGNSHLANVGFSQSRAGGDDDLRSMHSAHDAVASQAASAGLVAVQVREKETLPLPCASAAMLPKTDAFACGAACTELVQRPRECWRQW